MPRWPNRSLAERFWEKVQKGATDECWPWTAYRDRHGYGRFRVSVDVPWVASHRAAYALSRNQPIIFSSDRVIMHTCDNPPCCNPDHLREGTIKDNNRDSWDKQRRSLVHHRGERHGMARLTEEDVRSIRASSQRPVDLAKLHGVTLTHIRWIQTRKSWKHVD